MRYELEVGSDAYAGTRAAEDQASAYGAEGEEDRERTSAFQDIHEAVASSAGVVRTDIL